MRQLYKCNKLRGISSLDRLLGTCFTSKYYCRSSLIFPIRWDWDGAHTYSKLPPSMKFRQRRNDAVTLLRMYRGRRRVTFYSLSTSDRGFLLKYVCIALRIRYSPFPPLSPFPIYRDIYGDCKLGLTPISKNGTSGKPGFAFYIWSSSMPGSEPRSILESPPPL